MLRTLIIRIKYLLGMRPPGYCEPVVKSGRSVSRRKAFGMMAGGAIATAGVAVSAKGLLTGDEESEKKLLEWQEKLKGHFRLMSDKEKEETLARLERLHRIKYDQAVKIKGQPAQEDVLFGYAFNISKCKGYRDCVSACVKENNQDRESNMQYIRILEMENGRMGLEDGKSDYFHEVPAEGHFYLGTQCFQCEEPPCVDVCPVGATWQEPDGITVIDYDWCIGCRYCQAACPYWARRFNWQEPEVPVKEINPTQHYLGNRMRKKGVMEKCTFCIQRSREGKNPACVEACPTGARVFGNLLDPNSEIRYVLKHKKVFRLKEELKTDPKFWYYMD
jgi:molybdopterin-containing oxidoreductase family iron-sulfur binding subunit